MRVPVDFFTDFEVARVPGDDTASRTICSGIAKRFTGTELPALLQLDASAK